MVEAPGRSILAYFASPAQAEKAAQALRAAGLQDVQVDQVSRYADLATGQQTPINPSTGQFSSLAELTLGIQDVDPESGAALAASADASGYGGEKGQPGGDAYLVTVVLPHGRTGRSRHSGDSRQASDGKPPLSVDHAVAILKQHGGRV